ncbi:MAG: helix-turn-helix domain-containing protein [Clostridiales bacterium]|jgi:transcriptional regulator with XRE-family HTH domain|nr:helix-turn-helix domain-containing protein [Clostridiales bacterium]
MGKTLGKNLKDLRLKIGLYQTDIAQEFGVAQSTVTRWENGTQDPELKTLEKIADYFNVTPDFLLGYAAVAPALTVREKQALNEFRQLDDGAQFQTLGFMKSLKG